MGAVTGGLARRWIRFAIGFSAVLLTASCGGFRSERTLVVSFDDYTVTLDPHLQNHSVTWSVLSSFYDSLVRLSPEMQLTPSLAVTWEKLDALRWRLQLRPNVRFSNGEELSPDDVVASFERARSHPRSMVRHYLVGVDALRRESEHSVVVETLAPAPDLLNRLAFLFIVPRSMAGNEEIRQPVGTGQYVFSGRENGGDISAEGWRSWRGEPDISKVRFHFSDNEQVAVEEFFSGHVDVLRGVPDEQVAQVEGYPELRVISQPRLAVQMLAVVSRPVASPAAQALTDPRVRRALLMALDRPGWIRRIYRGHGTVASQYVHPVVFGYDPSIGVVPYDPGEATRLLAEAGYGEGFEVTLGHGVLRSGIVEAITEDLARVGVRVRSIPITFGEAQRQAREGAFDLFYYAWSCSTGDASEFLNTSVHSADAGRGLGSDNYAGYGDPAVDTILERADRELDPGSRLELLQEAQKQALEELPVLPLTIRWGFLGVSSRVEVLTRHDERILVGTYRWRR